MSEDEFEIYLSLLSKLLHLRTNQRQEIADELRDHLDARLNDLTAAGIPREQAMRQALEEFGDAASLADHFTRFIRAKKRRLLMRCTFGTLGVAAAAILLGLALWPSSTRIDVTSRAVADAPVEAKAATPATSAETRRQLVEEKLTSETLTLEFVETKLSDAMEYLADVLKVDILLDRRTGVSADSPITLNVRNPVSARTVLELVIEQLEPAGALSYMIRDGIVYITNQNEVNELQVYNCRDLLADVPKPKALAIPGVAAPSEEEATFALTGIPNRSPLVDLIQTTVRTDTWQEMGGTGSIGEFNGQLVVRNSPRVQREVRQLLDLLRSNGALPEKAKK